MGLFSKKSSSRTTSVMSKNEDSSTSLASPTSVKSPPPNKTSFQNGASLIPPVPQIPLPPAPNPNTDPVAYLKSLYAVRERTKHVMVRAKRDQLTNFTVDISKFSDVVEYVVSIIKVCS